MPAPRDLTGETYGSLTVARFTGAYHSDSKRSKIWLCHCNQCGRDEEIPQNLLPYNASQSRKRGVRYACSVCMRGACVVCGGEITRDTKENTCSDACHQLKIRNIQNLHYAKRVAEDPDFNRVRRIRVTERMQADPEYAANIREISRAAKSRYCKKEGVREAKAAYQAERWRRYKDAILEQRERFWKSLSIEEQLARKNSMRDSVRASKRRFYDWLRANPNEHQKYIERRRGWRIDRERQMELAKLQKAMQELNKHE